MEMEKEGNIRIDKWLWAVRIFKTRSLATNACKKDKVLIDNQAVKPSRIIKINEIIDVKMPPITRQFKVKGLLSKRLGAKLVVDYVEELTSAEEFDKLKFMKTEQFGRRPHGAGRPTKKERRIIDKLKNI
jgi:ribosome-associated heat shock protein Hsp15